MEPKLRILYVGDLSDPHVRRWIRYVVSQNITVEVLTSLPERIEGVKSTYIPSLMVSHKNLSGALLWLSDLWHLWQIRFGSKFDLIHIHQIPNSPYIAGALMSPVRTIVSLWDFPEQGSKTDAKGQGNKWKYKLLEKARFVTYANSGLEEKILKHAPALKHKEVIPISIDVKKLERAQQQRDEVTEVKFCTYQPLIPGGGAGKVLKAFLQLAEKNSRVSLTVIGQGREQYESELKRQVTHAGLYESIHFRGEVTESEYHSILNRSDVFLHTRDSGYSVHVLEALAFGLPVISTETPGISDIIIDEVNGLVIPGQDLTALSDAMRRLAVDKGLRFSLGRNAKELVSRLFDFEMHADRMVGLYEELTRENHKQ